MDERAIHTSWESFSKCLERIKILSDRLDDGWHLNGSLDNFGRAYLSKRLVRVRSLPQLETKPETEHLEEDGLEDGDNLPVASDQDSVTFEYHLAYNISYSCPVLCFNAWKTNGSFLTLEECWQTLGLTDLEEYKYSTLTQMDHPVLIRPFFTLHPCKTAELIGVSYETSRNVVVSWLSAIGPVVGLNLHPEYAKLTF